MTRRCSICFKTIKNEARINCKHYFCYDCINNWVERFTSCPTCLTRIKEIHYNISSEDTYERIEVIVPGSSVLLVAETKDGATEKLSNGIPTSKEVSAENPLSSTSDSTENTENRVIARCRKFLLNKRSHLAKRRSVIENIEGHEAGNNNASSKSGHYPRIGTSFSRPVSLQEGDFDTLTKLPSYREIMSKRNNSNVAERGDPPLSERESKERKLPLPKKETEREMPILEKETDRHMPVLRRETEDDMPISRRETERNMPILKTETERNMPVLTRETEGNMPVLRREADGDVPALREETEKNISILKREAPADTSNLKKETESNITNVRGESQTINQRSSLGCRFVINPEASNSDVQRTVNTSHSASRNQEGTATGNTNNDNYANFLRIKRTISDCESLPTSWCYIANKRNIDVANKRISASEGNVNSTSQAHLLPNSLALSEGNMAPKATIPIRSSDIKYSNIDESEKKNIVDLNASDPSPSVVSKLNAFVERNVFSGTPAQPRKCTDVPDSRQCRQPKGINVVRIAPTKSKRVHFTKYLSDDQDADKQSIRKAEFKDSPSVHAPKPYAIVQPCKVEATESNSDQQPPRDYAIESNSDDQIRRGKFAEFDFSGSDSSDSNSVTACFPCCKKNCSSKSRSRRS